MEKSILNICKKNIQEKIGVNKPDGILGNSDFEYISFLIEEKTKIRLSISTLKRIWNDRYDRLPHISTLNALAQFLDFENWQSFKKTIVNNNLSNSKNGNHFKTNKKLLVIPGILVVSVAIIFSVFYFLHFQKTKKKIHPMSGNVVFKSSTSIHKGIPNSVIFYFNIDNYKADSFFIQQSWAELGKVQIFKHQHILTSIYYCPGYHEAKLIANTSVIKMIPVFIETDGWTVSINTGTNKIISKGFGHNGNLTINKDTLSYFGTDKFKVQYTEFRNVGDFGKIILDNCQIETRIKFENTQSSCPFVMFELCNKTGMGVLSKLTTSGCISDAYICLNDTCITGRTNDLTDFGCEDFTKWQLLSISIKEKHAEIKLNGKSVNKTFYSHPIGQLASFRYTFNGIGSVDFVRIKSVNGKIIYQDEFNGK